jgi:bacterioferritin-associated ferredoxin
MFVCVCRAVTDREVKTVIEDGAVTVAEVTEACRAGGDCGACHQMIEDMIEDCHGCPCPSKGRVSLPLVPSRAA